MGGAGDPPAPVGDPPPELPRATPQKDGLHCREP